MSTHPFLAGLLETPDYLLQNLDFQNRRGLVVRINENAYRSASFLDERVFSADTQGVWFPLETLLSVTSALTIRQVPHYIFHIGHCGSTLISRLLGELPQTFSLREPITLLALAVMRRDLDTPDASLDKASWQKLFEMSLTSLSRTYHTGDRPIIKLTSAAGNLLGPVLKTHVASKALLLYVDLETWLATMLRAEATRENLHAYASIWLKDFQRLTGRNDIQLPALDDTQQAVITWLTMMLTFHIAAAQYPDRIHWLNFDAFLAAPAKHLKAAADFLGLSAPAETINALINGPLMSQYAKDPQQRFDADMRQKELAEARQRLEAEISMGLGWAKNLCCEIPLLAPLAGYLN